MLQRNLFIILGILLVMIGLISLARALPIFSNYTDNNATQVTSGTGLFNVTVVDTNGTALLEINGANYTATNLTTLISKINIVGNASRGFCGASGVGACTNATNQLNYTTTIPAGDNRMLIVIANVYNSTKGLPNITHILFNGTPLINSGVRATINTPFGEQEMWYLVNPPVITNGNVSINVNQSIVTNGNSHIWGQSIILTGVDQSSNPIRNTSSNQTVNNGLNATLKISALPGDIIINTVCGGNNVNMANQTLIAIQNISTATGCFNTGSSYQNVTVTTQNSVVWRVNTAGNDHSAVTALAIKPAILNYTYNVSVASITTGTYNYRWFSWNLSGTLNVSETKIYVVNSSGTVYAALSTLMDNFTGTSLNISQWVNWSDSVGGIGALKGVVNVTNGTLVISSPLLSTLASYTGINSTSNYTLNNSYGSIQLVSSGNLELASLTLYPLSITKNGSARLYWQLNASVLYARYVNGGADITINSTTYDLNTHEYLRINETAGQINWDYSSDSQTWIHFGNVSTPFDVTNIQAQIYEGTTGVEVSTTDSIYDNFNIFQSSVTNSCTYLGSGTWGINGTDQCVISTTVNVNGDIICYGNGGFTLTSTGVLDFDSSLRLIYLIKSPTVCTFTDNHLNGGIIR